MNSASTCSRISSRSLNTWRSIPWTRVFYNTTRSASAATDPVSAHQLGFVRQRPSLDVFSNATSRTKVSFVNLRIATLLVSLLANALPAQERDIVVTGGWLFASTGSERIHNPGVLIRAGKFLRVGGDLSIAAANAERIALADTETIIPGLFDLHAHYAVELFNAGRKDETVAYPSLFLANGVTSTFPAGEMDPKVMH